ncbi:PA14 domain-containing protein [Labilibaculum euxinus]|uniref:HYR domain-containing protein n=1 Tax=Labilibaculum euxinus TaxID=2686357 RepID=A0A7M4D9G1_9BACT|nr:PA14 domain-containing protein [Labilibaculum euxinus]MUP39290.1 HYR domain-containing protein [Labilibaculum euxinus]MVB08495.1 HYR domain-containing protein [Labilibaculum euxinus]
MNKWLLFFSVLLIFTNINVSAKNEPSVSISVDKDMILKDGGVAIVTVQLSENFKGKAPVVELKYETNGTGAMNYDFTMSPEIYYKKFGKNETSFSFAITGIYQQWGSSKVDLNITLYNIKNATPSGAMTLTVNINDVIDDVPPVFQNPQTDITVNASGSDCGEIVNYDIPQAIDNFPAFSGTLPGYTYLGELYNHTYYYSNTSEKATTAMQNAINSGGHLVTITSQAENDFIDSKVGDIWIGLTDAAAEGTFVWCNGEAVSYTNWNSGEPNNSGNEDYTQMYSNGKWNDIPDTYWKRYVVEFEGALVTQTGGLPSGSLFPVGTTVNTFTATDNAGNTATHSFNVTVADVTPPKISQLQADYYDGKNFDTFMETLPVDEINYSWGSGAPESSLVGNDNFSIRFQGSIQAVQAGTYTFYTTSDDGVRLWVAGQQVINNWTNHSPTVNSGTISLSAGQIVPIVLEFYEQGGGAVIKLEWQGPGVSRQFVKSNSTGTCQDITLDLSAAGGLYNLTADEVDPGYSDECGIASRSLSKSVFTCDDAGSNSVTFTVVDVNGNSSECIIDVIVTGVPDISLPVIGDTKCIGDGAQLTIQGSEGGVVYSAYKGGVQIGSSVPGNGADVSINIPTLGFSVGDNLINIKAVSAVCEANLTNTGIIVIYQSPNPVGIYHE